jgi:hypothetical protein
VRLHDDCQSAAINKSTRNLLILLWHGQIRVMSRHRYWWSSRVQSSCSCRPVSKCVAICRKRIARNPGVINSIRKTRHFANDAGTGICVVEQDLRYWLASVLIWSMGGVHSHLADHRLPTQTRTAPRGTARTGGAPTRRITTAVSMFRSTSNVDGEGQMRILDHQISVVICAYRTEGSESHLHLAKSPGVDKIQRAVS